MNLQDAKHAKIKEERLKRLQERGIIPPWQTDGDSERKSSENSSEKLGTD